MFGGVGQARTSGSTSDALSTLAQTRPTLRASGHRRRRQAARPLAALSRTDAPRSSTPLRRGGTRCATKLISPRYERALEAVEGRRPHPRSRHRDGRGRPRGGAALSGGRGRRRRHLGRDARRGSSQDAAGARGPGPLRAGRRGSAAVPGRGVRARDAGEHDPVLRRAGESDRTWRLTPLSFSAGPETPIWVPPERLRSGAQRRGFSEFADFRPGLGRRCLPASESRFRLSPKDVRGAVTPARTSFLCARRGYTRPPRRGSSVGRAHG